MSETIRPALSEAEWAKDTLVRDHTTIFRPGMCQVVVFYEDDEHGVKIADEAEIPVAALLLEANDWFTREMVDALALAVMGAQDEIAMLSTAQERLASQAIENLEALLPPEDV